jgi:hypothetical protein
MTVYKKAKDIGVGDVINVGLLQNCRGGEVLNRVARIRVESKGRNKGEVRFYEKRWMSDRVDLFHYARPNSMVPTEEG